MKIHPTLAVGVLAAAAVPHQSWALGLGEITLFSFLNEPFRAEVELLESDALADSDVHVDLASDAEFERLGVSREFFLMRIDFEIESDESGRRVVLTTEAPLREPYLDFIIEARWPDGRLLREYTVLIDLPPRQSVSTSAGASSESGVTATESAQSETADVASEVPTPREYDAGASPRPAPGAEYLVTSNDTLWRIASEGAADGVSVEQTMLEIVAANPAAFQGGNINGLKSGYVLQIPGPEDIRIDLATALDEVAIQNDEWQQGISRAAQGLTLVADSGAEDAGESAESEVGGDATVAAAAEDTVDDGLSSDAPAPSTATANNAELDALTATVTRLESNLLSLEAQLAERDEELAALRAALASQPAASSAPVVVESAVASAPVSKSQPLPLWPFLAGLFVLIAGVGAIIWRRRRGATDGSAEQERTEPSVSLAGDEEVATARLSDPQIMASKAVEEAQIYIAYGRTDQAVEVLSDALAEGLSSPTLNMCLLECFVELEQFAEAGALLSRLEQSESPELLSRARQMLLDAGVALTPSVKSEMDSSQDEVVAESEETSVLSEFSFSTDPTFDLQDEALPEAEISAGERDVFGAPGLIEGHAEVDAEEEGEGAEVTPVEPDDLDELGPDESHLDDALIEGASNDIPAEPSVEPVSIPAESIEVSAEEQGLQLTPLEIDAPDPAEEVMEGVSGSDAPESDDASAPYASGLSLEPMEVDTDSPSEDSVETAGTDESIYGAETDPIDSKLDLARAYIDMGDEDGARPVLMDVIKEGDLAQQAEARELLLRLEAS